MRARPEEAYASRKGARYAGGKLHIEVFRLTRQYFAAGSEDLVLGMSGASGASRSGSPIKQ